MANSFHRSGRAPLISPDEAFRSAQYRASKLAQQRRNADQTSRNAPNPANRRGNISNGSRKAPIKPAENPSSPKKVATPSSQVNPSQANITPLQKSKSSPTGSTPTPPPAPPTPLRTSPAPEPKKHEARVSPKTSSISSDAVKKESKVTPKIATERVAHDPMRETRPVADIPASRSDDSKGDSGENKAKSQSSAGFVRETFPAVKKEEVKKDNKQDLGDDFYVQKEKKKRKPWFSRKSKTQVATDLEESKFDVVSSSDDLDEVKSTAHLTDDDADKIVDTYADYKVRQQVRSNGRKVEKLPRIYVVIPRKKKFFKVITSIWSMLLIIAFSSLCVYGYTVYKDAELGKEKDAAYAEGVKSSGKDPDIASLMKLNNEQLSGKILAAQGANFPKDAKVDTFSLAGWTYPGGSQKESKVEIDFCYSGEGQKKSKGSVFFYTPDAVSTAPDWTVDTISLTQTPCEGEKK